MADLREGAESTGRDDEAMRDVGRSAAISRIEAVQYIGDMAGGLADISRAHDLAFLTVLIEQVRMEAEDIAGKGLTRQPD